MIDKSEDIKLLNLVREDDQLAFKLLFETYFTPLCRFMHRYIYDESIVEEHAMDIFTYIWENRKKLQIHTSFKAFLFKIARNKCLNTLRQKRHTISIENAELELGYINETSLEAEELDILIQEAVMNLPNKCRGVFHLSRSENLTNKEIATQLNISVKTVEGQMTKALKEIKMFLVHSYSCLF